MDDKEAVAATKPGSTAAAKAVEEAKVNAAQPAPAADTTFQAGVAPAAAARPANSRNVTRAGLEQVVKSDEEPSEQAEPMDKDTLRVNITEDLERAYALSMNVGVNRILERIIEKFKKFNEA
jgi:hypothetical protein